MVDSKLLATLSKEVTLSSKVPTRVSKAGIVVVFNVLTVVLNVP